MNENIDLTKILKNCPIGWEFYSTIYGNVTFLRIGNISDLPIKFFFVGKDKVERYGRVTKQGLDSPLYNGECTFFPSRDQRDWSKFTAPWYKKDKFDPNTLESFNKVLVRDCEYHKWTCDLFSHMVDNTLYKFQCFGFQYNYCIPYNDETKHLVGTTEEAPEYYRYWE